jgi:hypothetical protein
MPDDYDQVCQLIKAQTRKLGNDDAAFTVMNCIATVADEVTGGHLGPVTTGLGMLYTKIRDRNLKGGPIPNPWFVFNGHEDRPSPITEQYKKGRTGKSIAGTVTSVVGTVASVHTAGINVASSVMHANASGTTAVHMMKIIAIANSHKQSETIADWCKLIMAVKAAKLAIRGGQLAGGLIPGGSIPAAIIAAVGKTGVKLTFTNAVYAAAANIHWRAYQEQAISGGLKLGVGGDVGPGSQIYWEIFTKRGLTWLLGSYDIAGLVREPGGWEALADKLLLI